MPEAGPRGPSSCAYPFIGLAGFFALDVDFVCDYAAEERGSDIVVYADWISILVGQQVGGFLVRGGLPLTTRTSLTPTPSRSLTGNESCMPPPNTMEMRRQ